MNAKASSVLLADLNALYPRPVDTETTGSDKQVPTSNLGQPPTTLPFNAI